MKRCPTAINLMGFAEPVFQLLFHISLGWLARNFTKIKPKRRVPPAAKLLHYRPFTVTGENPFRAGAGTKRTCGVICIKRKGLLLIECRELAYSGPLPPDSALCASFLYAAFSCARVLTSPCANSLLFLWLSYLSTFEPTRRKE